MKNFFTTKRIVRAAIIAALYVALSAVFTPFAFGPFQLRPAEALCILPLFFPEAIPALYIGCMLFNLTSPYLFYDVVIGALVTLISAFATYLVGAFIKNDWGKTLLGGFFPVLFNALIIPLIIVFLCDGAVGYESATVAYWSTVGALFFTQSVWVYGLGIPLYFLIKRLREKKLSFFE